MHMKNLVFGLLALFLLSASMDGGSKIPSVNLKDVNGNSVNTAELSNDGKPIVISFWATWCAPCKKEMPDLLEAQKELAKDNYIFLLISDESQEQISEFKKKTNYDFIFLKSTKSNTSFGIYALPTTFIYNERGVKADEIIGAVQWNSKKMIDKLKNIK